MASLQTCLQQRFLRRILRQFPRAVLVEAFVGDVGNAHDFPESLAKLALLIHLFNLFG